MMNLTLMGFELSFFTGKYSSIECYTGAMNWHVWDMTRPS